MMQVSSKVDIFKGSFFVCSTQDVVLCLCETCRSTDGCQGKEKKKHKQEEDAERKKERKRGKAEQIKAKREKTYNHSAGFPFFFFCHYWKEKEMAGRDWRLG